MKRIRTILININVILLTKMIALIAITASCKTQQNTDNAEVNPVTPKDTIVVVDNAPADSLANDTIRIIKIDTISPEYKTVQPICLYGVIPETE